MSTSTQTRSNDFYNDKGIAIGWLNRAKLIDQTANNKGSSYWSLSMTRLTGSRDNPVKTTIDFRVKGEISSEILQRYADQINGKVGVFAKVIFTDVMPKSYTKRDGTTVLSLEANLMAITHLKIGTEMVVSPEMAEVAQAAQAHQGS